MVLACFTAARNGWACLQDFGEHSKTWPSCLQLSDPWAVEVKWGQPGGNVAHIWICVICTNSHSLKSGNSSSSSIWPGSGLASNTISCEVPLTFQVLHFQHIHGAGSSRLPLGWDSTQLATPVLFPPPSFPAGKEGMDFPS